MEIEAKLAVPNLRTLRRLEQAETLAGLDLGAPLVVRVDDTYLDTSDRRVIAAGYAFRRRQQAEGVLLTLKQLSVPRGAIHRREEVEVQLQCALPPARWPDGVLRSRVLGITAAEPLRPLVSIRQKRIVRSVCDKGRLVAHLSLDKVKMRSGRRRHTVLEVEVELEPTGTEEELVSLARSLEEEWHLSPVSLSKFERALHYFDGPPGTARLLSPSERQTLMTVSQRTDRHARRAAALLALDNGDTQEEAAKLAGVTDRSVRYWLSRFRDTRLSLFPESVLTAATREQPDGRQEPASTCPTDRPQAEDGGEQALKAEAAAGLPVQPPSKPGLCADDSMAEAARKTFRFHLQRMEFHEPGAREGKDIEELHDMRVATRRMRAAMTVFGDYLDSRKMKPYLKGLRRTGRALGPVRDLDVFREKMQGYLDPLAPAQEHDLDPLLAAWEREHRSARRAMLVHLGSERYLRFKTGFGTFLQTPGAGALSVFSPTDEPLPHRLCHVVPLVIHQRAADVRAYEQWVTEPEVPLERLHQLRIACKALRYALEFFREILGAEAKSLIDTMKEVQDHLGDLQDAVVASNLLGDFLTWGTWGHRQSKAADVPGKPVVAQGVATYLAARQREIQQLARDFPQVWLKIQSIKFHEQLVSATAVLW